MGGREALLEDLARRIRAGERVELPDDKLDYDFLLPTVRQMTDGGGLSDLVDFVACFEKVGRRSHECSLKA